ncbi:MAG: MMPL family transporter [bacterium]
MLERIVNAYTKLSLRLFIPIGICLIALTYFCVPKAVLLFKNIKTDFATLLPDDYASVKLYNEMTDIFGQMKNLTLILETKDPEKLRPIIPKLAEFLSKDPAIKEVDWRKRGYDFFDEHKLFYPSKEDLLELRDRIDRRIQREKLGSLYISFEDDGKKDTFDDLKDKYAETYSGKITSEFYTDDAETVFLVNIFPKGEDLDVAYFKKFSEHIRARIAEFDINKYDPAARAHYTGGVITSVHEYDSLTRDLKIAGIVSGLGMLFLVVFYFRKLRAILFVFLPLGCGLIWSFAIAHHAIGHLNMTTAFLFSIISGLGIDFGILLNSRYYEERLNGAGLFEAMKTMILLTGRSSFTAAATTSAAFLVLIMNDFKGFTEFGFIAGIGVMVILLAYILMLPCMRAIEEKTPLLRKRAFTVTNLKLERLLVFSGRRSLRVLAALLIVSAALAAFFLKFNYNFANIRAPNPQLELAQELEHRVNPQKAVPSVILVHSKEDSEAAKAAVEKIKEQEPDTLISSARNVYSLVPKNQDEKLPAMAEIKRLLDDDVIDKLVKGEDKEKIEGLKNSTAAKPFVMKDVPSAIKDFFVDKETGEQNQLVYIFLKPSVDLKDGKLAIQLARDIREIKADNGKTYNAVSSSVIFADVLTVMIEDSPRAILLSFAAVFLLLLIDFRNLKQSFIAMMPLLCGVLLMLGVMAAVGLNFNFFNMIVLPIILGMGIDCGVHMFHRFKEEGYKDLPTVMRTTGGSIVMTTLTTIAGFSGMIFAHHKGLQSIGIAASVGLGAILIVNLLFFPAILAWLWPQSKVTDGLEQLKRIEK